jgi:hypothetical protein
MPPSTLPTMPGAANTLFYGDNLPIPREYIPDVSVDLIYLDPSGTFQIKAGKRYYA